MEVWERNVKNVIENVVGDEIDEQIAKCLFLHSYHE